MLALRFPFAASSGVLVTLAVFSLLWHFVSVPIDIPEVLPTVKVDWKRLRNDTPVRSDARRADREAGSAEDARSAVRPQR